MSLMKNFFSKYKFIFFIFNFVLIFFYLFPGSILGWIIYNDPSSQPQITRNFIVSSNHVYAFLILSIIGFLTYKNATNKIKLFIYLIVLSVVLEIFHFFIPERSFEFSDLFGNLLGVLIMVIINQLIKKYEYYKN
ncbi:VanZ family protein [Pelagibacterales bacterium SAG-MED45]|nr:VanZ family protein [Pelagibacterales bacterium SAG-MED45]